jgi:hypothetical protein
MKLKTTTLLFVAMMCGAEIALAGEIPSVPKWCGHVVPADGGAYVPGVDVNGNAVVSANVSDGMGLASAFGADEEGAASPVVHDTSALDWPIEIPITIDLAGRMGIAVPGADVGGEGIIGLASITRDGKVTFNGTDITVAAQGVCAPPPPGAETTSQNTQKSVP